MSNPKAPWPRRTPIPAEVQTPRDVFLRRLGLLGASADVIAATAAGWDDPEFDRDRILGLSDASLRAEIQSIEHEHYQHTHTPEQEAEAITVSARAAVEGTVSEVVAWLGSTAWDRPAAARAVIAAETARERPRRGVLEAAQRIIG